MKLSFKHLLSAALLMAMPLTFTSCEGALDDIFGEWSRPGSEDPYVLSAALKEGALVSYTIIENGVEKVITFKRVGNEYVLITPATTRSHDRVPPRKYILDWEIGGTGDGGGGGTGAGTDDGGSLLFTAKADDGTTALKAETKIKDGSTQVIIFNGNSRVLKIVLNPPSGAYNNNGGTKDIKININTVVNSSSLAILQWGEPEDPYYKEIKLDLSDKDKTQWFEYADLLNLSTNKYSQIYITTQIKNESEEIEDVKFKVYYKDNSGNKVRSMYLDYVEARTYILEPVEETE